MSSHQQESIEERLAKRRRLRNKRLLKNGGTDEAEIIITQTIDRKPTAISTDQRRSSLTVKTSELPSIEKSNNDKQTSAKPPVAQNSSLPIEKPVTIKETPIVEYHSAPQNEKPVVIKEPITPVLPPTTNKKLDLISKEIRGYSTPNQIKSFEEHSQSNTNHPEFHSKPITRAASEQIVSMTTKHQPVDSVFAKQNSLALPYLFNKRLIDAELARATSLDSKQLRQKTVWD